MHKIGTDEGDTNVIKYYDTNESVFTLKEFKDGGEIEEIIEKSKVVAEEKSGIKSRDIKNLVMVCLVIANTYLIYQATLVSSSSIGISDARYNGILFGASELIVYLSVIPIAHKMKRKKAVIATSLIGLVGSILLVPISDCFQPDPPTWIMICRTLITGLLVRVAACINYTFIYGYAAELFPTNIRATMCGIAALIGRLAGSAAPYVVKIGTNLKLEPLVFCSSLSIVILLFHRMLEETLDKKMK